jgi:hypothetical protein
MNAPADKLLLSLDEVKDLTGVGRTNLYREIREKRLRARKQYILIQNCLLRKSMRLVQYLYR